MPLDIDLVELVPTHYSRLHPLVVESRNLPCFACGVMGVSRVIWGRGRRCPVLFRRRNASRRYITLNHCEVLVVEYVSFNVANELF